MSFILDALKKSENDRQEYSEAEFATLPSSSDTPAAPRWLWVLGGLLALNIIVVLGLMFRSGPSPNPVATQTPVTEASPPAATSEPAPDQVTRANTDGSPSFTSQVAEARRIQPQQTQPVPVPAETSTAVIGSQRPTVSVDNLLVTERANLPTLMELRANGTLQLPDLHIDIHVYDSDSANRFTFINMNKYRENSTLDEGPLLREITSDGVILEYRGYAFMLPRD
jgi:general secretion pathway protein B